jgi:hypothetical protein
MRSSAYVVILGLAGILAGACSDVGPEDFVLPPGSSPPITTDADVYMLGRVDGGYAGEAVATYTNTTGRPVFYRRCTRESSGPIYGLRRTGPDSGARAFVGSVWACVGGVPTGRVPAGGTLTARVDLGSWDSPQAQPPITPEQRMGRFRIEFGLCAEHADSDDCEALPQMARESNAFELRFAGP